MYKKLRILSITQNLLLLITRLHVYQRRLHRFEEVKIRSEMAIESLKWEVVSDLREN